LPGDDQVGPGGGHAFGIGLGAVADDGQGAGGGRIVAAADGGDQVVAGAGRVDQLGGVWRQGDLAPAIVARVDGRRAACGGIGRRRARGGQQPQDGERKGADAGHARDR